MTEADLKKIMDKQERALLIKNTLPEHSELMECLRALYSATGRLDMIFWNKFMAESVELLKHAVFLYEDGYFDCAFYSVRQSIENLNNMLYLSENDDEFEDWKAKGRFPTDNKIKKTLQKANKSYSEVKSAVPEIFQTYNELLSKANKYIHKQGFDTFFINQWPQEEIMSQRTSLFVDFLKQAIGMLLLMNIVFNPLALSLCDSEVEKHIYFDPMDEPIPVYIFEKLFDIDIVQRIKQTKFYNDFTSFFLGKEELNDATYAIVRYQYFDVNSLHDIEKQLHILSIYEKLFFRILKSGARISHFYFQDDILEYKTSITPAYQILECSLNQFNDYLVDDGNINVEWKNMYISTYKVFDTWIILQHNDELDDDTLKNIQNIINYENQKYTEINCC